ncbi:MAG: VTT domain-containing protein, partial [Peptostreptococcaceae bacterium]
KKHGFKLLFIAYACPFIPACLVTIACALCKTEFKQFVSAMLSGKLIMFIIISYVGSDIQGFVTDPVKMIIFLGVVLLAWIIGNKVNKSLNSEILRVERKGEGVM